MSQDNLLTKEDAAKALNVSVRTLQRMVSKGEISVSYIRGKKGDEAVFDPQEIERVNGRKTQAQFILKGEPMTAMTPVSQHDTALVPMRESALELFSQLLEQRNYNADVPIADKFTLSLDEAAKLSGLSKNYLRDAIHAKKLKAKIIGRGWKINRDVLKAFATKVLS